MYFLLKQKYYILFYLFFIWDFITVQSLFLSNKLYFEGLHPFYYIATNRDVHMIK